jgi:hypothetical protein
MLHVKNKSLWVAFQYEKLPKFCFTCGVIMHGKGGCGISGNWRIHNSDGASQFDAWLRASSPNMRNNFGDGILGSLSGLGEHGFPYH